MSTTSVSATTSSKLSNQTNRTNRSRGISPSPLSSSSSTPSPRRVVVPGIGTALQLACGEVRVRYPDGSQLSVEAKGTVRYEWQNGHQCNYGPADLIPTEVRDKLTEMPKIIKYLARPSPDARTCRTRPVR